MNSDCNQNYLTPGHIIQPACTNIPDACCNYFYPTHDNQGGVTPDGSSIFYPSNQQNLLYPNLRQNSYTQYAQYARFKNNYSDFPLMYLDNENRRVKSEVMPASNDLSSNNTSNVEAAFLALQLKQRQAVSSLMSAGDGGCITLQSNINDRDTQPHYYHHGDKYLQNYSNGDNQTHPDFVASDVHQRFNHPAPNKTVMSEKSEQRVKALTRNQSLIRDIKLETKQKQIDNFVFDKNMLKEFSPGCETVHHRPIERPHMRKRYPLRPIPVYSRPLCQQEQHQLDIQPQKQTMSSQELIKPSHNGREGHLAVSDSGSSKDMGRNSAFEPYIKKFSDSFARNNAFMNNIEPIVIDKSSQPVNMSQATSHYNECLMEENARRIKISSCNVGKTKPNFFEEEYYRQVLSHQFPPATKEYHDWLKLFRLFIKTKELEGRTIPQTTLQSTGFKPKNRFLDMKAKEIHNFEKQYKTGNDWTEPDRNMWHYFPSSQRKPGQPRNCFIPPHWNMCPIETKIPVVISTPQCRSENKIPVVIPTPQVPVESFFIPPCGNVCRSENKIPVVIPTPQVPVVSCFIPPRGNVCPIETKISVVIPTPQVPVVSCLIPPRGNVCCIETKTPVVIPTPKVPVEDLTPICPKKLKIVKLILPSSCRNGSTRFLKTNVNDKSDNQEIKRHFIFNGSTGANTIINKNFAITENALNFSRTNSAQLTFSLKKTEPDINTNVKKVVTFTKESPAHRLAKVTIDNNKLPPTESKKAQVLLFDIMRGKEGKGVKVDSKDGLKMDDLMDTGRIETLSTNISGANEENVNADTDLRPIQKNKPLEVILDDGSSFEIAANIEVVDRKRANDIFIDEVPMPKRRIHPPASIYAELPVSVKKYKENLQ